MKRQYTPDNVTELEENEIFVFGSTRNGSHLGGAARIAVQKFGAIMGNGFGPQGRSYAIPSIVGGVNRMLIYVNEFVNYAKANPDKQFLVTKIGCGRAKYTEQQVAPLFKEAYFVENIVLPEAFCRIIEASLQPEQIKAKEEQKKEIQELEDSETKPIRKFKIVGKIDLSQFNTKKKKLNAVLSSTKENIFIIDTNVFVEAPLVISKIEKRFRIVLSAKVIDELDKLKVSFSDNNKRSMVGTALKQINEAMDKRNNISMELADLSLLPPEFDKKSPDNMILSLALKFSKANPIILTSDNGLQVKAKGMNISVISLKDFLSK